VFDAYVIQTDAGRLPDGQWRELFNSDAAMCGGANVGNLGADLPAGGGRIQLRIPANAVLILQAPWLPRHRGYRRPDWRETRGPGWRE
jgi:hypothetical protein